MDEWTTHDNVTTDTNGNVDFRGFYGEYRVTVTPKNGNSIMTIIERIPYRAAQFVIDLSDQANSL